MHRHPDCDKNEKDKGINMLFFFKDGSINLTPPPL